MKPYFQTDHLTVGYQGQGLIHDIQLQLEKGSILTLIGPNGAGKSTILKSITRQLEWIGGAVFLNAQDISAWSPKQLAKQMAVVLTDRVHLELTTCAEIVAMGRYPYTNVFGTLTSQDRLAVWEALERVHALDLAEREFNTLSDGQRQRILLARAICQEPEILVLDEPTAYLDVRYKVELLEILREMAQKKKMTIVMSLHEIDLAMKVSDYLVCVKGDTIEAFGTPEEILQNRAIERLYDMQQGSYNLLLGSVELTKPRGSCRVFVVAGGGYGIPYYRMLQKQNIPFATGLLFENDVDYQVAKELGEVVFSAPAFEPMPEELFQKASALLLSCEMVMDAGTPIGTLNAWNGALLQLAKAQNIPIQNGTNGAEVCHGV